MNFKFGPLLVFSALLLQQAAAKPKPKLRKVAWQSANEINILSDSVPKPILIDVYTDWCHYCKLMDATTYRNDSVVAYLHKYYYRFKLNAEQREPILWQGKKYNYNERYKANDFSIYLGNGTIVYPTTVIMLPNGQPYTQYGQLKTSELELLLKYFIEADQSVISLAEYAKSFKPRWK